MSYRRVDDEYSDPREFDGRPVQGVAGLMSAARAGNIALATRSATPIADDKGASTHMSRT